MGTATFPTWFHSGLKATFAGLVLALSATAALADPPARVGRISDTQGAVWFYEPDQGEWVQAQRNRPVTQGDRFTTDRGARVEVQIGSATVRLGGNTELAFAELNDERIRLQLSQGSVALNLRRDELARDVVVLTQQGRFEPLRAGRYRVDAQERSSFGATLAGAMRYESRDSALTIDEGQRAEFWKERGEASHYAWTEIPNDRFADWVRQEERDERYDRRWSSPEMTGADDLYRHGEWDRHPEFGTIWYPNSVGAGWAPYRDGQWSYVRPWGWTWVDNAPWGFAPFHYGRWVNFRGRWGWCPGQPIARPVYSPALVGWIGNGNVSISISAGSPGYVGWVPLSPYDYYAPHYHGPVSPGYIRNVNVPYQRWHRYPHDPRREPVMQGSVPYTNQGVAGGVTVVNRDVLRQRTPISAAVVSSVAPNTVTQWQRVRPEAPVMVSPAAAPTRPAPVVTGPAAMQQVPPVQPAGQAVPRPNVGGPGRGDDGRDGPRRGPGAIVQPAPAQVAPVAPAAPVAVMPATTLVRPQGGAPVPVNGHPQSSQQAPIPVGAGPQITPPKPPGAEHVQPVPSPAMQQSLQAPQVPRQAVVQTGPDRKERAERNERDEREAQGQSKEQRREQMRRMERPERPGQQRND